MENHPQQRRHLKRAVKSTYCTFTTLAFISLWITNAQAEQPEHADAPLIAPPKILRIERPTTNEEPPPSPTVDHSKQLPEETGIIDDFQFATLEATTSGDTSPHPTLLAAIPPDPIVHANDTEDPTSTENPFDDYAAEKTPSLPTLPPPALVDNTATSEESTTPPETPPAESDPKSETAPPNEEIARAVESIRSLKRDLLNTFRVVNSDDSTPNDEQLAANYYIVTPRVKDPRWNRAMELLVADKCTDAQKLAEEVVGSTEELGDKSDPGVRYAMARIDLCAGNRARGLKTLSALAERRDPIGTIASQLIGKTDESDPYNQPIERLSDLIKENFALAKSGKVELALRRLDDLYSTADSRQDRFNVRLAQANILENAHRIDEAAQLYLQLYRRTRGSSANSRIEDRLERLERIAKKTYLSFGERVDRMRHLISRGKYRDAKELSIYNAKLRRFNDAELAGMTNFRLALVAERKRDREKAVTLFQKADRLVKDDEVRPRIYLGWARALRRLDRDREAIALYQRLANEYPNHDLAGEAHYQAGRLYQFLDDNEDAIKEFDAALATIANNGERDDDPSWASDALWRAAFGNILLKRWDKAVARLQRLKERFGDETDSSDLSLGLKATYWIAVANLEAGDRKAAAKGFQQTLDHGKLTWYGRLAEARMEREKFPIVNHLPDRTLAPKQGPDGPIEVRDSLDQLAVERDPRLAVAVEFGKLGLWRDAKSSARPLLGAHPASKGAAAIVASADLIEGDPAGAHWRMRSVLDESGPNSVTLRNWATAFPNVYSELANKFGSRYNVDPSLVQAIIRQESGFRPQVKSYAGAVGLMQLMPGTARYTAKEFREDQTFSRRQLLDPETNVELGTMYIRLQTAFAGDSIPIALAGYNAGAAPQSTWIQRYGDRDLDAWVESITYQEARGYVRKVYTSYVAYSQLYKGILPKLDLDAARKLQKKKRVWGEVPELKKPSS